MNVLMALGGIIIIVTIATILLFTMATWDEGPIMLFTWTKYRPFSEGLPST